ncbi:O10R2 protein, partial [Crocuta crocuta]
LLMANSSRVTEFLLLGFSSLGELQPVLFVLFLCLYLIILSGNLTIISVIRLDRSLHTPMYFFLCILSTSEVFYTIVILPKMLINLLSVLRTVSFMGCATQMFFFLGFAVTNCLLLGVMGYDRYAAICQPLRYPVLMNWRVCAQLAATCIASGFLISLVATTLVNLRDQVSQANFSSVTEFLLLGFSNLGEIQLILFAIFLCLYLIILSGNITIITVIRLDRSLHVPMYFFLGILSISETCYTLVVLPKMLINLLSLLRTISFVNCAVQMFFFLGFAVTNCMLLGVMGYDRYAAICHPLRYPILMSWQVCGQLAATCAVIGFLFSLTGSLLVFELPFCGPNKINHYFCDILPVIQLACTETYINELVIFIGGVVALMTPLTFICISYGFIVHTILKIPSADGKRKAFSTCASHLT